MEDDGEPLEQAMATTAVAPLPQPIPVATATAPTPTAAPAPDAPSPLHRGTQAAWAWLRGYSLTVRMAREAVAVTVMLTLYRLGRGLVAGRAGQATTNAYWLIDIERSMGIFVERAWQQWTLARPDLLEFFNWYYETLHFPATGAFLVWVFLKHAKHYARVRNSFVVATLVGFLMHWTWPLLPPRLLPPEYGFVDTIGADIYGDGKLGPFTNQVAAMPSLHFGWSLTIGVGIVVLSANRWRWATLAHPCLTLVAIVVTANHYILDAVVAVPVMAIGLVATLWKPLANLGDARSDTARKADDEASAAPPPAPTRAPSADQA
ncbi:MAG TPA: phosphatase PAP2 family protein [Candidatus Thermoplasmatota archaeon]|nr:phosphatase PAP2 family protein [Candidatus Thermoplasmatota archaeon]